MARASGLASTIIIVSLIALLAACGLVSDRLPDYRYRLTVEVDTPEGLKTGSNVIQVRTELAKKTLPDANALAIDVTGEAVAVDLGKCGVMFALLRSEESEGWAGGVMNLVTPSPPYVPGKNTYAAWHQRIVANRGLHIVPRNDPGKSRPAFEPPLGPDDPPRDYPMLVRFADLSDPRSVERVDPDDLAGSFGQGVKLRRITVQLTDAPVTKSIDARLRWLGDHPEPSLKPNHGPDDWSLAATIHHGDLRRLAAK